MVCVTKRKNYDDWTTFQVSLLAAQDTQTCCGKLVKSRPFVGLSVVLLLANAAFIGYAADLDVREAVEFHHTGEKQTRDFEQVLIVVGTFFTCAFTLELILKIFGAAPVAKQKRRASGTRVCVGHVALKLPARPTHLPIFCNLLSPCPLVLSLFCFLSSPSW